MQNKPEIIVFDTLFDAVSEAVLVIDKFQNIKIVNTSAEKMFEYKQGELANQPLQKLLPNNNKEGNYTELISHLNSRQKTTLGKETTLNALKKDMAFFTVEISINPFQLYDEELTMILVTDLTLKKKQELEVKKRIEAENKAKIALKKEQELNELKTKFLSLVSHQFKTPLTGISISSMLLAKYKLTEDQKKREKHIAIIDNKVYYLNKIINDFLSIEKLEKGEIKYNLTHFKIKEVLDDVIEEVKLLLKGNKIVINPPNIDEITIHQDKKIIELVISNLLTNAVKYSRENTKILIEITQDTKNTIIKVIDKGFGIPAKDQKNIFNRYFRAENVLLIEGTGIGLNIIKDHLTYLGCSITFTSKHNVGTTFVVTIPNKFN